MKFGGRGQSTAVSMLVSAVNMFVFTLVFLTTLLIIATDVIGLCIVSFSTSTQRFKNYWLLFQKTKRYSIMFRLNQLMPDMLIAL